MGPNARCQPRLEAGGCTPSFGAAHLHNGWMFPWPAWPAFAQTRGVPARPLDSCHPTGLPVNRLPAVNQRTRWHVEQEVIAPRCAWLLFRPGDGHALEMAEQERPHPAMGHHHN